MALNDDILERAIGHEIGLRRHSSKLLNNYTKILQQSETRLINEIARRGIGDVSFTSRRLDLMLKSVQTLMHDTYLAANGQLNSSLRDMAGNEVNFQTEMLKRFPPVSLDIVSPTSQQVHAAARGRPFSGRVLKDWYKDIDTSAFKRVKEELKQSFVEGRTTDQIVRSIRGTAAQNFKNGILEINRRGARTMVRTVTNFYATVAREETFRANRKVLKGVQWHATLDNRTSAICRGRDGIMYPVDSGPRPPAHPNCRSTMIPITKSWKELGINLKEAPRGTRSSMNGAVPGKLNYNDWLKQQSVAFQDDVLGKTKAQLWRKGGVPLKRFVDLKTGREYSLSELRANDAASWQKAFGGGTATPGPKPKPKPKPKPVEYERLDVDPKGDLPTPLEGHEVVKKMETLMKESIVDRGELARRLTFEEAQALSRYTGSGYREINGYLRKATKRTGAEITEIQPVVDLLDDIFEATSLSKNVKAFRGISTNGWKRFNDGYKVGDTWIDKGFTSASVREQVGKNFGQGPMLEFLVPKGAKAFPTNGLSSHVSETELLFHRGLEWVVKSIDPTGVGGLYPRVVLELR